MDNKNITIKGARVHNLKNIDVEIPKNKLTVITGMSGSGKSSLAFDTIYNEGQRRYMESISSYARQFMGSIEKPDVDLIEGLSPAIAIDQKTAGISPRSTVGTMSEVYDYIRLLFTRIGKRNCYICGKKLEKKDLSPRDKKKHRADSIYVCVACGKTYPPILLSSFSFNNPQGACPSCRGLGKRLEIDPDLVFPNMRLTLAEGAIRPWSRAISQNSIYSKSLKSLAQRYKFSLNTPVGKLTKEIRNKILYGDGDFEGVITNLERRYYETDSDYLRSEIRKYMVEKICSDCGGKRLNKETLKITIENKNIIEWTSLSIDKALSQFDLLLKNISKSDLQIAKNIILEIKKRLQFLQKVGLGYLSLNRSAETLAGGEAQRIRLATLLGSNLAGVIYILDEPSIGLHARDNAKLIKILQALRDLGNSVIVVEHDEETITYADYLIDMGPEAGELGGEIVAAGLPERVKKSAKSLTARYLTGKKSIAIPAKRRKAKQFIIIKGAKEFNLKNIDVKIPLNTLTVVSGVSGSGKSTLISEILTKALVKKFYHSHDVPGKHSAIIGTSNIDKVVSVDQSPIGRSPRSNPATFTGIFGIIRDIFAATEEARAKKYNAGHFSFNVKGGRCELCKGDGVSKFEMYFLPDVYVTCQACGGNRYNPEILEIKYNEKNITEVLEMTVTEAHEFFSDIPILKHKLGVLEAVGLGYIRLGQPATTLSGGEAQRIKLATDLARQDTGKTMYILDEPTTGLHFEDVNRLLKLLQALVDKGNTVLIIEHNMDVIKCADHIIDLGPEGGEKGGYIVAEGTPEKISQSAKSYTGQYLKKYL